MSRPAAKDGRAHIMVADDDPAIVDSIKLMLEFYDYEVTTTIDGSAVRDMREQLPDLLLLDIWMSGEDGKEICRQLKSQPQTRHIPIIMVSASRDVAESAREAGADDFMAKPFQMENLLSMIGRYLAEPATPNES